MSARVYELIMLRGPDSGSMFVLADKSLTIGRDPLSNIRINDPEVSRQHALLIGSGPGNYRIQDLGSTNGTYVNGKRVTGDPVALRPADEISMGGAVTLLFQEREQAPDSDMGVDGSAEIDGNVTGQMVSDQDHSTGQAIEPVTSVADLPQGAASVKMEKLPEFAIQAEPVREPLRQSVVSPTTSSQLSPIQDETKTQEELSPNLILGLVLLLLCCCVSLMIFIVYLRGDWLLREFGLVP